MLGDQSACACYKTQDPKTIPCWMAHTRLRQIRECNGAPLRELH